MIENFFSQIIADLGATGVLLLGVAFIFWQGTKKLYTKLEKINGELGEIILINREMLNLWKKKGNG